MIKETVNSVIEKLAETGTDPMFKILHRHSVLSDSISEIMKSEKNISEEDLCAVAGYLDEGLKMLSDIKDKYSEKKEDN